MLPTFTPVEPDADPPKTPAARLRTPVRWPFRILAMLIVLCGGVAIAGLFANWTPGVPGLDWRFVATLPGIVWLLRLAGHAVRGKVPAMDCWPFASPAVMSWYFVIVVWLTVRS